MFYKPSYCCNCGDRIERAEWRLWDSRRFCQLCETEYKAGDIAQRAVVGIGLVLGIFGFSAILWPVRHIEPGQSNVITAPRSLKSSQPPKTDAAREEATKTEQMPAEAAPENVVDPYHDTQKKERTRASDVTSDTGIYYCGATTKKGTPCSRRVKTKGRCWQHEGIP